MKKIEIYKDWECEGMLRIKGGYKTLSTYRKLNESRGAIDIYALHVFPAFSNKQFEEGKKKAGIKEGEKIISIGGGIFGTKEGFEAYGKEILKINDRIKKECDPQEVYVEEYNNYECMLDCDGDTIAIKLVADIFGWEVAEKLQRFSAYKSINELKEEEAA